MKLYFSIQTHFEMYGVVIMKDGYIETQLFLSLNDGLVKLKLLHYVSKYRTFN